jgi:hypothetical protein
MCVQGRSPSPSFVPDRDSPRFIQLAALQLIERGKITPEDPVEDYLPQMANPVIIEDEMADNLVYKPAHTVIRVKHLLNFTNGTFYPFKDMMADNLFVAYATVHPKDDHITGFFNVVKVREFFVLRLS